MQDRQRLPQQLRLAQGQALIRDKRDLWEGMVRNRYHLPALRSPLCTVAFMQEVRQGTVWCPRKDSI